MPQLTKKTVDALKGPGRYSDGDGLYLEVSANGAKSWILRVTVQGRRRDIGLGGLFWVSLVDAREEARKLRKVARKGGDPVAERKAEQGIPTLEQAARDLYDKLKPGWRKVGVHVKHWISSLERDVFPTLGDRPINTITSGNILSVLTPIWHQKPETARRVHQRLRQRGAGQRPPSPSDAATVRRTSTLTYASNFRPVILEFRVRQECSVVSRPATKKGPSSHWLEGVLILAMHLIR